MSALFCEDCNKVTSHLPHSTRAFSTSDDLYSCHSGLGPECSAASHRQVTHPVKLSTLEPAAQAVRVQSPLDAEPCSGRALLSKGLGPPVTPEPGLLCPWGPRPPTCEAALPTSSCLLRAESPK